MNKKYQQFVPLSFILAAILVVVVLFLMCKPKIEELNSLWAEASKNSKQEHELEEQVKQNEAAQQAKDIKLRALKPIYESKVKASTQNLGVFGTMFDDVIKIAQVNGLLIRSIEYNMAPEGDPLYDSASQHYHVCELKFYFVATYAQLHAFLSDMNRNFPYLSSISRLAITAFPENPNYLLIQSSIILYSQKMAGK